MDALKSLILLLLIFYIMKEHKKVSMNNFRDNLFNLRHELFLIPLNYDLSYDDKLYRHYERLINNQIRFAHKLSYTNIYLFDRFLKKKKIELKNKTDDNLNEYPDEIKNELAKIKNELTKITIYYLIKTSPMFWIIMALELLKTIKITNEDLNLNVSFKKINNCINVMASEDKMNKIC